MIRMTVRRQRDSRSSLGSAARGNKRKRAGQMRREISLTQKKRRRRIRRHLMTKVSDHSTTV